MRTRSRSSPCAAVRRWEEAGAALASALKSYYDSCSYLETTYLKDSGSSQDLVTRIDSSLDSLHLTLDRQLAESRSTLARTRNRIAAPLYMFPDEVLSEIFLDVVYVPTKMEQEVYPGLPIRMPEALKMIYQRLHSLIGVCSVWRNVAINCGALWSVIPMVDPGLKLGPPQRMATNLSLQRAGDQLHLAAVLRTYISDVESMKMHAHRLRTINIKAESNMGIILLLVTLLHECDDLTSLSELSLCQKPRERSRNTRGHDTAVPQPYEYVFNKDRDTSTLQLLSALFQTLSVIRIEGALFHWDQLAFSTRLVELRLHGVVLGYNIKMTDFLRAVSSARGLRDLRIISVVAFPDTVTTTSPPFFSLPDLELLSLGDLDYNVLGVLFRSIAPGSHQLRLWLTLDSTAIRLQDGTQDAVEYEDLYELLRPVKVDTVLLDGFWEDEPWISRTELRGLLSSMPQLKTLMMHAWEFHKEDWDVLIRPPREDPLPFPNLTTLHLTGSRFHDVETIREVVKSYSLQNLFIGARIPTDLDYDNPLFHEVRGDVVDWLKAAVPNVCLAASSFRPLEFSDLTWRLW
ncbi:hypothetical protein FRC11_003320 [Ceratobasidium sp. 423]|nr:hypothetical protein FRC11_003320 [Ceratobasidium sp. 423]